MFAFVNVFDTEAEGDGDGDILDDIEDEADGVSLIMEQSAPCHHELHVQSPVPSYPSLHVP